MIDEYPPHRLRCDREKVRPILPIHFALIDELQIRFVDKSGRLKRVADALASPASRAVVMMRKIASQPSLAPFIRRETRPGPKVTDLNDLIDYIRETGQTAWHAVGTCRMGHDDMAVTDPQLRVRGVTGLRVADISVLPTIVSPNTNAPAFLVGEKAADMILNQRKGA